MTLYVDNMHRYAWVDRGSGRVVTGRWSHLLADHPDELAGFAARLGLRPEWIQYPGTARERYDIVEALMRTAGLALLLVQRLDPTALPRVLARVKAAMWAAIVAERSRR